PPGEIAGHAWPAGTRPAQGGSRWSCLQPATARDQSGRRWVVPGVLVSAGLSRRPGQGTSVEHMTAKIALITGANKSIGFETARPLGSRGMTVLIGARDETRGLKAEKSLREGGADARFVQLDVTDAESIQRAAEWIDAEHGHLDVLVNNAGTAS